MNQVQHWVQQIILIALLAGMAELILPRSDLQRYARLSLSLVLTLVVLQPLLSIFGLPSQLDWPLIQQDTAASAVWREALRSGESLRLENQRKTLALFRSRLEERSQQIAEGIDRVRAAETTAVLEEDPNHPEFGMIRELRIILEIDREEDPPESKAPAEGEEGTPNIEPIEAVRIEMRPVIPSADLESQSDSQILWEPKDVVVSNLVLRVRSAVQQAFLIDDADVIRVGVIQTGEDDGE